MKFIIYVNLSNLDKFKKIIKAKELPVKKEYLLFSTEWSSNFIQVILSEDDFYFLYDNYIKPTL